MAGAALVFNFNGRTTGLSAAADDAKRIMSDLSRAAVREQAAMRAATATETRDRQASRQQQSVRGNVENAIAAERVALQKLKGTYDDVLASALKYKQAGASNDLVMQYIRTRREVAATGAALKKAADDAAAAAKLAADAERARAAEAAKAAQEQLRIENLRAEAARRKTSTTEARDKTGSRQQQSASGSIQNAIAAERVELLKIKGTYDDVVASALRYKQAGASNAEVLQYIRLRREVAATAEAKKAAAAEEANAAKLRSEAVMAATKRQADFEAMVDRQREERAAAISANRLAGERRATKTGGFGGMAKGRFAPMAANSLAVGFQDAVSVYQVNGSALSAISAAGNNIIFLLTLINPMAGAIGAVVIGLTQLGIAWLNSGDNAEESAKKQEEATKRVNDSLKDQWELRQKMVDGDVPAIDKESSDLAKQVRDKEKELDFLKAKEDLAYAKRDKFVEPDDAFSRDRKEWNTLNINAAQTEIDGVESRRAEAFKELDALQAKLAYAKEVQKAITPQVRKNAATKDPSKELLSLADEIARLKDETATLTEKETELQQKQRDFRKQGLSNVAIDNFTKAYEANKTAKDAAEAKKKADRDAETEAQRAKQEADRRKTEAEQVRERNRTPWEKYNDERVRLRGMVSEGLLTPQEGQRANQKAFDERNKELMSKLPDRQTHAQSLIRGSVEAARVASTGRRDEKLETIAQQQLEVARESLRIQQQQQRNPMRKAKPMGESG